MYSRVLKIWVLNFSWKMMNCSKRSCSFWFRKRLAWHGKIFQEKLVFISRYGLSDEIGLDGYRKKKTLLQGGLRSQHAGKAQEAWI